MASETKTGTSRKSNTETKTAPKAVKKTAAKTTATTGKKAVGPKTKAASPKADKPAAKKATASRKTKATGQPITADARLRHIEVAAYYIAERSGFGRSPAECWIAAESEIDGLLLTGKLPA